MEQNANKQAANNYTFTVETVGSDIIAQLVNGSVDIAALPTNAAAAVYNRTQGGVKVNAPMPGKILGVKVSAGQAVKKGDVLVVLEAMKMENEIVAPQDGTVASVNTSVGEQVEAGCGLMRVTILYFKIPFVIIVCV